MGLIVATEEQTVVGTTALPGPFSDPSADWIWHSIVPLQTQVLAVESGGNQGAWHFEVDNKSMRKVRLTDHLVFVVANLDVVGAPVADVGYGFRVLSSS